MLGRFISPDWWDMHLPGVGTNRYAYSDNDPINKSNPSGHVFVNPVTVGLLSGVIAAAAEIGVTAAKGESQSVGKVAASFTAGFTTGAFGFGLTSGFGFAPVGVPFAQAAVATGLTAIGVNSIATVTGNAVAAKADGKPTSMSTTVPAMTGTAVGSVVGTAVGEAIGMGIGSQVGSVLAAPVATFGRESAKAAFGENADQAVSNAVEGAMSSGPTSSSGAHSSSSNAPSGTTGDDGTPSAP